MELPMTSPRLSRNGLALAAVCLSSLMFGLEISSVPAILPALQHALRGDFKDMQWVMNAYTIACTSVLMATGTLADRFGRKRLFLVNIALFGVASVACGCAPNMAVMIGARDLHAQRLDVAGMLALSLAVFGSAYYITQGADLGYASPRAMGIAIASALCLLVFVLVERRVAHPMFDFSVFRIRPFSGALLGSVGMNISFWPLMIYLPLYFHGVLGYGDAAAGCALLAYTLPTLVIPPWAERLAARYRPGWVIPGGLFTIGAGFFLMKWGSGVAHPDWSSMLPGCVCAGVGLGMTNTTVTNTTTGAVTSERAGMASGIDMSARMITLAINIALMGLILVSGVTAALRYAAVTGGMAVSDDVALRALAESIAGGLSTSVAPELARAALLQGFQRVLLYGGIGVWTLGAASFVVFGAKAVRNRASCARALG
jgi:hypothetical protein